MRNIPKEKGNTKLKCYVIRILEFSYYIRYITVEYFYLYKLLPINI